MTNILPTRPQILHDAELIYNYHRMQMPLPNQLDPASGSGSGGGSASSKKAADAVFALCSLDLRVARRAAQLFLDGYGRLLIFSGGSGKLTADHPAFRDDEGEGVAEAVVFARVAVTMGVAPDKILVEDKSTNTGENVRFTFALLRERGLLGIGPTDAGPVIRSFILVQKPYMERRTYATFMKQWPGFDSDGSPNGFEFSVTSPVQDFHQYPDDDNPRDLLINVMVGDLVRIRDYPALGFQIPQEIPLDVWEAGQRLIAVGFDQHLP